MAVTAACFLPVALVAPFLIDPAYEAVAKVTIQRPPEVLVIGQSVMPDEREGGGRRSSPLDGEMALVLSDRVLGRVVDQMGPAERPSKGGLLAGLWKGLGFGDGEEPTSPDLARHGRILSLRARVELEDEGGGSVLAIRIRHRDAARASFLANAIADAYVLYEEDRRRAASRAALSWLTEKENELREQISRRQGALAELATKLGDIPSPSSAPGGGEGTGEIRTTLQQNRFDLFTVEQRIAQLEPEVAKLRAEGEGIEEARALRERYGQAVRELEEARLRYTDTHPEFLRLQAMVGDLSQRVGPNSGDPLSAERLREYEGLLSERSRLQGLVGALQAALSQRSEASTENAGALAAYHRMEREVQMETELLSEIQGRKAATTIKGSGEARVAQVLDYAVVAQRAAGLDRLQALALGLGLVGGLGLGAGALRELLDRREYDPHKAAAALGVPLLASIPRIDDGSIAERQSALAHATVAGESYRNLRTALLYSSGLTKLRSFVVASAVAGEGKTTISVNLSSSFAHSGRRVLLVDADMRRPRVNQVVALPRSPGLSEVLREEVKVEDGIRRPLGLEFDVMTAGEMPENPSELLGLPRFDLVLSRLTHEYDLVVLDAPVLLAVADALLLAAKVDGVLLVNRPGWVDRNAFPRMVSDLQRVDANVLGVVANQVPIDDPYTYPTYLQSPYIKSAGRRRGWRALLPGRKAGRARPTS